MAETDSLIRFLAAWALVHETADEGWKAAVERGSRQEPGEASTGPDAFVDALSAIVADEKERLKEAIADGGAAVRSSGGAEPALEQVRFEIAELRGRIESLQASIDALVSRLPAE